MASVPALPYIGSKISLISNSEIRYEGILYTINTVESTVALQNVRSFGTEGRRHPDIPPSSEIYDFIIFRGKDIKDVTVSEPAKNIPDDPAIVSMNIAPSTKNNIGGDGLGYSSNSLNMNRTLSHNVLQGNDRNRRLYNRPNYNRGYYNNVMKRGYNNYRYNKHYNNRNYEKTPYVVGELESQPNAALKNKFSPDFDFSTNNSKFDKSNILDEKSKESLSISNNLQVGGYDKNASFFDNISCETLEKQQGKDEKVDREKLRLLDVDTFGIAAAHYRSYMYNKNRNKNRNSMRNNRNSKMLGNFNFNYYNRNQNPYNNSNTNRYAAY